MSHPQPALEATVAHINAVLRLVLGLQLHVAHTYVPCLHYKFSQNSQISTKHEFGSGDMDRLWVLFESFSENCLEDFAKRLGFENKAWLL